MRRLNSTDTLLFHSLWRKRSWVANVTDRKELTRTTGSCQQQRRQAEHLQWDLHCASTNAVFSNHKMAKSLFYFVYIRKKFWNCRASLELVCWNWSRLLPNGSQNNKKIQLSSDLFLQKYTQSVESSDSGRKSSQTFKVRDWSCVCVRHILLPCACNKNARGWRLDKQKVRRVFVLSRSIWANKWVWHIKRSTLMQNA